MPRQELQTTKPDLFRPPGQGDAGGFAPGRSETNVVTPRADAATSRLVIVLVNQRDLDLPQAVSSRTVRCPPPSPFGPRRTRWR
jgi:hypothetical protein